METVQVTLYPYSELSEKAKQKAQEYYLGTIDRDFWSSEYRATLEDFCDRFPVKVIDWRVDSYRYDFTPRFGDFPEKKGKKLASWLLENHFSDLWSGKYYGKFVPCEKDSEHPNGTRHVKRYSRVLFEEACPTGYCADYDIRGPLHAFIKNPSDQTDLEELLRDCLDAFFTSWREDIRGQETEEYISDFFDSNSYRFTENGKVWKE